MPSVVTEMSVAGGTRTLVAEKLISKVKPSVIFTDNELGAADAYLVFNDVFTPSVTNAVPVPVLQTIPRLHINVAKGDCHSTEDFIKDIEFLGLVQVMVNSNVALPNCFVTMVFSQN